MTSIAWALVALTALLALTDWWAVRHERRVVRVVAKPGTLVALAAVALAAEPVDGAVHGWVIAALVLSLAGDVALLLPERWFVAGLASFLLAHVAYVVALQLAPQSLPWALAGLALVVAGGFAMGRRVVEAVAARDRALRGPVVAYLVVISAMVVSAIGTAAPLAAGGALLFYASDATLAWNRFVVPLRWGPLAVMVTYHLGQAGLVAWSIAG